MLYTNPCHTNKAHLNSYLRERGEEEEEEEGKGFSVFTSSLSPLLLRVPPSSRRHILIIIIIILFFRATRPSHLIFCPVTTEMPGTLPRFPTMPALLSSLPRGVNPPSLPRGLTMPSLPTLPSLPSMPRGVTIPSLPRGMSLHGAVTMSTVSQAPRRLLQDCCSVLDHQTPGGNRYC